MQFGPTVAEGLLHLVVCPPCERDGVTVASALDRPSKAIERKLAAVLVEQNIGVRPSYVVSGRLDDAPSVLAAHVGTVGNLEMRIRLNAAKANVKAASTRARPRTLTSASPAEALDPPAPPSIHLP